jgi:hypothetical protein
MTTHIHMLDRDAAVALAKAVSNTLEPEQVETADTFAAGIANLQEQINIAREQLARLERELDALELGGPSQE